MEMPQLYAPRNPAERVTGFPRYLSPSEEVSMRKNARNAALLLGCALFLVGCGTNPGDRAVSGGMLGAGAGAVIGAMTGNPATGAAIGAASGAFVGAVTDPCTLNLGNPVWRDHGGRAAYERRCGHPPPP
jgi:hypothetical protein